MQVSCQNLEKGNRQGLPVGLKGRWAGRAARAEFTFS